MATIRFPTKEQCKQGMWALLSNDWIVGPIISFHDDDFNNVYAKYGDGTWMLDLLEEQSKPPFTSRTIVLIGSQLELLEAIISQTSLANDLISELILEETHG